MRKAASFGAIVICLSLLAPAAGAQVPQDGVEPSPRLPRADAPPTPEKEPLRVRLAIGPQVQPGFPGNDSLRLGPMINVSRARGDRPFGFGAPGDGNAVSLLRSGRAEFGPLVRLEGQRRGDDLIEGLPRIGRTVEAGAFAQTWLGESVRLRGDLRKGIGGHKGWISQIGMDYVRRDGDHWLASLGPRVVFSDARYQRAWFGVSDEAAVRTGIAPYAPGGGIQSAGATSRVIFELTPRWGIQAQAMYARLIDDPGRSPLIRSEGSRDQLSAGIGLSYTFNIR